MGPHRLHVTLHNRKHEQRPCFKDIKLNLKNSEIKSNSSQQIPNRSNSTHLPSSEQSLCNIRRTSLVGVEKQLTYSSLSILTVQPKNKNPSRTRLSLHEITCLRLPENKRTARIHRNVSFRWSQRSDRLLSVGSKWPQKHILTATVRIKIHKPNPERPTELTKLINLPTIQVRHPFNKTTKR